MRGPGISRSARRSPPGPGTSRTAMRRPSAITLWPVFGVAVVFQGGVAGLDLLLDELVRHLFSKTGGKDRIGVTSDADELDHIPQGVHAQEHGHDREDLPGGDLHAQ